MNIFNFESLLRLTKPQWGVSIWHKNYDEPYDPDAPLCSEVNMGAFVKRADHYDHEHNPPESITLGRITAFSEDRVLIIAENFKTGTLHPVKLDRATFEKEWIGD